ncbi:MAG: PilC/PilY family type IV pilus protein [candidate division WOR-3 bacterium]
MKRLFYVLLLITIMYPIIASAQTMNDYCQWPPFLSTPVQPNVLLLIDTSGSMGWKAYSYDSDKDGTPDKPYDPNVTYEGYFDPEKYYTTDSNGVYVETAPPTGIPCQKTCTAGKCQNKNSPCGGYWDDTKTCSGKNERYCCTNSSQTGDCTSSIGGNYLNYAYMSRIDLLRWAMTGGKPSSCDNLQITTCDPEVYGQPNANLSCDASGCILISSDGTTKVKARWDRITGDSGGLLFQLKKLGLTPRMGAMFFDSTGVNRTVYIGDFTGSASYDGVNPYKNTITAINYEPPGGATPIGPALWDAYNYLAQLTPKFGGPQPQTGSGNEWKNPMFQCVNENNDDNCQGNEFKLVPCAKNFIILLTDGQWNYGGDPTPTLTCSIDSGVSAWDGGTGEQYSADPVVPAYWLHKKGFTNAPTGLNTYVEAIYTIGMWLGGTGEVSLKNVSMYGSFDRSRTWPGGTSDYPRFNTCWVDDCSKYTGTNGKGSSCTPLPPSSPDWDKKDMDGNDIPDGIPDTFFKADDAVQIKNQIVKIILDILRRVSAGTAVSILASGEGQGANLLQAVFYPQRTLGIYNTDISWTGAMQNLWYYIDPLFQLSTIREDTDGDRKLNLVNDYITQIYFDQTSGQTLASRCQDTDGDGDCDVTKPTINFEDLKNLWEGGIKLFQKQPANRGIYTNYNGFVSFNTSLASDPTFRGLLQAANETEAQNIINYVRGTDITNYRSRTVTLNVGGTNVTNTWKLADIVHSTPRIQSWVPLNDYYDRYNDNSYDKFTKDLQEDGKTLKTTKIYTDRGMVYVGANDGMLHAFYLGKLKLYPGTSSLKAELLDVSSTYDPGDEVWSFIPKNALPYLKYLMHPDYCHLYYVDASPYLFDASIGTDGCTESNYWDCSKTTNTWRTILIGSMNLGGACRNLGSTCTDCVKTPVSDIGYSSYFALDITDQENPKLLWEFSNPALGFSTSGPVVFRAGPPDKNGRWFVMFASGPTGPIDTAAHNFLGKSDQNLKLFILDLKTGQLLSTVDTGITNAFGGSVVSSVVDLDDDYQDDVVYIPYSKWDSGTASWKGGIGRFITNGLSVGSPNFTNRWSNVITTSGPVTSAPVFLRSKNKHELWMYFGTGRYFYKTDDLTGRRRIYGIKEPCYSTTDNIDPTCTTTVSEESLSDSTSSISSSIGNGWYINLDCAAGDTGCTYTSPSGYSAERVITTPLASPVGAVFFTTFSPTSDICGYGGSSYIWAVNYRTGGVAPSAALQGKALLQLSTGEIREIDLKTAFTDRIPSGSGSGGGRRSIGFFGVPPQGQGLSAIVPADPIKRFIFIKEK